MTQQTIETFQKEFPYFLQVEPTVALAFIETAKAATLHYHYGKGYEFTGDLRREGEIAVCPVIHEAEEQGTACGSIEITAEILLEFLAVVKMEMLLTATELLATFEEYLKTM